MNRSVKTPLFASALKDISFCLYNNNNKNFWVFFNFYFLCIIIMIVLAEDGTSQTGTKGEWKRVWP